MGLEDKKVLVIGGGIAGLSAALELARFNIDVEIVEKSNFLGGHAIQFSCKATNKCVKCGSCMVEERLKDVVNHLKIKPLLCSDIEKISKARRFTLNLKRNPEYIDPKRCTKCGICFEKCPSNGAIIRGFSQNNIPLYAINPEKCLYFEEKSCTLCRDVCPEEAVKFDKKESYYSSEIDAIIVATGFHPFNPVNKPYGYGLFPNVITNLELEIMLRQEGRPKRPSDGIVPNRIAFIQCVGSRDAKLNHLWCSKVCCGSALRMSKLIKVKRPETEITFFYIDVQTFGKDFHQFYKDVQHDLRLVRAIPGDIFNTDNDRLWVTFYDTNRDKNIEELFDMVVLSIGITPRKDSNALMKMLQIEIADSGFVSNFAQNTKDSNDGIFITGTALCPMSIAETVADACKTAWKTIKYLDSIGFLLDMMNPVKYER